jgi:hypothetical protein
MKSQNLAVIRNLHRRLGTFLAFFLVLLVVSGMLLNHSQQLDLVHKPLYGAIARMFYGSHAQTDVPGWPVGDHWFYNNGQQLSMDGRQVGKCQPPIRGAVTVPDALFVLCDEQLLLLDPRGQLVESIRFAAADSARLGEINGMVILETNGQAGVLDPQMLGTSPWSGAIDQVRWSQAGVLPEQWSANISIPTSELNLERFILDLHSGRILGQWHMVFMDLLGILLLLLAVGGIWTWYARKR